MASRDFTAAERDTLKRLLLRAHANMDGLDALPPAAPAHKGGRAAE